MFVLKKFVMPISKSKKDYGIYTTSMANEISLVRDMLL